MNRKIIFISLIFLVFIIFSQIASASISVILVQDSNNLEIESGVINNNYKITLNGNLSGEISVNYGDSIEEINLTNNVGIYFWNTSSQSGERVFTIGQDSFTFNVLSKVDELFEKINGLTIYISDDDSYVEIQDFNLEGTFLEMQNIEYNQYSATINLAHFLDGLNANISVYPGALYPEINVFSIVGTAEGILDSIFGQTNLGISSANINQNPQQEIENIMDYYDITYDYNTYANLVKDGNYYMVYFSEGYNSVQSNNLQNQIHNFINSDIQYFNPLDISDEIFRLTDYSLTDYLNLDLNYQAAIDFSGLQMSSGEYTIYFDYIDDYGNQGVFPLNVILDITPQSSGNVENNSFIPPTQDVADIIQEISGLDDGQNVTINVHGSSLPSTFVATTPPTNTHAAINYIEINISSGNTGNYKVNFSVADSYDKNKIQAYVYENNSWTSLSTVYLRTENNKHYFYFTTPHFSQFAIMEKDTTTSSVNNNGGRCNTVWTCSSWSSCINGLQTRECYKERLSCDASEMPNETQSCFIANPDTNGLTPNNLINLNNNNGNSTPTGGIFGGITGAVIGALGGPTGARIVFIVIIILGFLIYFYLRKRRKRLEKIKKKESEENPPVSEEVKQEELKKEGEEQAKAVKPNKSKKVTKKKTNSRKKNKKSSKKKKQKKKSKK